jgi:CDP-glucose 4,6-dehydratase
MVGRVLRDLAHGWAQLRWQVASSPEPQEAGLLQLDGAKANRHLGWRPFWNLEKAIHLKANWYRRLREVGEVSSADDLAACVADAVNSGLGWATA